MDMFKLLARSTGLQKSAPSARRASQHIPSAGGPIYEADGDFGVTRPEGAIETKPRGKKRKRTVVAEQDTAIPEQLNFFGNQGGQTKSTGVETGHEGKALGKEAKKVSRDARPHREVAVLSEEECRQIFKKHKLKITILDDDKDDEKPSKRKKRKGAPDKAQGKKDPHSQLWPQPLTSFTDLRNKYSISSRLAENLDAQGYREPTEVQLGALPLLLGTDADCGLAGNGSKASKKQRRSEVDLLTIAPTGSGKTLAFLIPILQSLVEGRRLSKADEADKSRKHHVQAVIVAPTHELVDQIVNEAKKLAVGTGIKIGGMKKGMRVHSELQNEVGAESGEHAAQSTEPLVKADVLVSTPLMMLHAISGPSEATPTALPSVRYLVLDEADVLLDPLFREQTLGIWNACPNPFLQTSLWSATIGSSIETLAQAFILSRRRNLHPKPSFKQHILRLVVGLKDSAIPSIAHRLTYAASEQGKLLALRQLLHPSAAPVNGNQITLQPPFLIFTQTISRAIALHSELLYDIPPEAGGSSRIAVLHSDLSDTARSNIMAGLRKGEIWIVITTDLLSRGVDVRGLNGVVNYDIPNTGAAYVHRVGRTGRQGREGGVAVTLYTKEDIPYVKNIANVIAASERAKGKTAGQGGGKGHGEEGGVQKWLLDALPNVSKKTKQELKRRGVESRRATVDKGNRAMKRKGRISTKSGFERRMEDRKRGAVAGSQRRAAAMEEGAGEGSEDEDAEWGGIEG